MMTHGTKAQLFMWKKSFTEVKARFFEELKATANDADEDGELIWF